MIDIQEKILPLYSKKVRVVYYGGDREIVGVLSGIETEYLEEDDPYIILDVDNGYLAVGINEIVSISEL